MTHPPDEILSALVDGEAVDANDAAHVEDCAACQERIGALRHVAATLAEPVAVPAHLREAAVTSALVENTGAAGAVRRIATARRARAKAAAASGRRMSAASAAAALLVALGVGGWLLSQGGATTDPKTAARSNVFSAGPEAKSDTAAFSAGDIGDYTETAPIADRYRAYASGLQSGGSYMASLPCPTPEDRSVVWHAELTYNGIEAYARVLVRSQSDRVLQVLARENCELVESQAI